jgi:DNA-binding transcriptional MerR regulator
VQKLNEYVKIAVAAQILGDSQNTLRARADAGRIPVMKNPGNGHRLFRQEDLAAFCEASC